MKKKLTSILGLLVIITSFSSIFLLSISEAKSPPTYEKTFVNNLKNEQIENKISKDKLFTENLATLFFPNSTGDYGILGNVFKTIAISLIFAYIFYSGVHLVVSGKKIEDLKKEAKNLGYITIGAIFIWGAGWLFGTDGILSLGNSTGLKSISDGAIDGNSSFFFQFLTLLKGGAFIFAIIMTVATGIRTIMAGDADKSKKLVKGTLNVVGALAVIKITDFLYYIASSNDFVKQATDFILDAAKFCGYLYGLIAVILVFYAGYQFLTDGGKGDGFKKAKTILINMFVSGLVLFGFLLILYQIFAEFS